VFFVGECVVRIAHLPSDVITLPIELWQIGNEISDNATRQITELQLTHNITFKNVKDYTDDYSRWQGYQIKAFIVKYTEFDEIILCDCDVLFGINPELLFNDKNYIDTGSFLFKDYLYHYPTDLKEINQLRVSRYIFKGKFN
jgi:alpha-N-acetylglucosamine transferase